MRIAQGVLVVMLLCSSLPASAREVLKVTLSGPRAAVDSALAAAGSAKVFQPPRLWANLTSGKKVLSWKAGGCSYNRQGDQVTATVRFRGDRDDLQRTLQRLSSEPGLALTSSKDRLGTLRSNVVGAARKAAVIGIWTSPTLAGIGYSLSTGHWAGAVIGGMVNIGVAGAMFRDYAH